MMFDRGRLDTICHCDVFYGEKKDQIGRMKFFPKNCFTAIRELLNTEIDNFRIQFFFVSDSIYFSSFVM